MFHATRSPCQTCARPGKPAGVGCHDAPETSSSRTNAPTLKAFAFATVTESDPWAPSAASCCDAVLSGPLFHLEGPTMMIGCVSWLYEAGSTGVSMPLVPPTTEDVLGFAPLVLTSRVTPAPEPRSVIGLWSNTRLLTMNVPGASITT